MQKHKVVRRMRVLLLVGFALVVFGATSSSAGVHVYLPPIPLPPAVVFNAPPVFLGVHPVPPPPVYYAPPVRYRYVDHQYHGPDCHHHKPQHGRRHHKHHGRHYRH